MDSGKRLSHGEKAARDGRFEEALADFVWFHEHALEHEPAYSGVRLSFALASWLELAEDYPPALDALKNIRDRGARALLAGSGDRDLFHDVESINDHLNEHRATHELFVDLNVRFPELAAACASIAMRALVKSQDYRLARTFIPDPAANIRRWSESLTESVTTLVEETVKSAAVRDAYIRIYADYVSEVLQVLAGVGEEEEAQKLKTFAIESVEAPDLRASVQIALSKAGEI